MDVFGNVLSSQPSGKSNIHPAIINYLEENEMAIYNTDSVRDAFLKQDLAHAVLTPYANYRTWCVSVSHR